MSVVRDRPYSQFNFLLRFRVADSQQPDACFREVSGLEPAGSPGSKSQSIKSIKVPGSHKVGDVTLKRGIVNSADLWSWLQQAKENPRRAGAEVSVMQLGESGQPLKTWKLIGARPVKYKGPTLSGKGTDVAIEELEISCEGIELVEG